MYGSLRFKPCFREEVDKFLEAAEKHAMTLTQNNDSIICPCSDCKNHPAWKDVTIIRSHLIMRGFVKDYTVWIQHDEIVIDVDPQEDAETLDYLNQYVAELDAEMDDNDHEQGGDASGWDGNDEGGANNDGGGRVKGR
jgi:hypothetical protein